MNIPTYFSDIIKLETAALQELPNYTKHEIEMVINLLYKTDGKVILSGVGKSAHIGKKIAATLSSTGTPAFFVHASEGIHGDLGMIEKKDTVILISNSGETQEVLNILPTLNNLGCKKIAITANAESTLANVCDAGIYYYYTQEADHLKLAPTTSSTLVLVIGDAIAATLSKMKDFTQEDFYLYHPGGSLGAQLQKNMDKIE